MTNATTRNTAAKVKCIAIRPSGAPTTHPLSAKIAKPAAIARYHQPYQRLRNPILLLGLAQIFYCTPSKVLRYYLQFPIELCIAIATQRQDAEPVTGGYVYCRFSSARQSTRVRRIR